MRTNTTATCSLSVRLSDATTIAKQMITVIIPYFQKSSGILANALASIAAQQNCPLPVHVIVVDDASPVAAGPEIFSAGSMPHTLQVIQQLNGGPGAARNTGLDNAPHGTRYVAFLDSDDEWTPDHLARAVAALDAGFTFYFADHYQLDQSTSAFLRAGRLQVSLHPALSNLPAGLHVYQGDMLDQIIRGNLIGTSTVVYTLACAPTQRFKVEFTNAGEDYLFWMELVHSGAKIAFSTQCEARYGKGVNVYASAGWGSEQHLLRVHNELKYRKTTAKLFILTEHQNAHLKSCVRSLRLAFARDLLHRLAHRKSLPMKILKQHFRLDPWSFFAMPLTLVKAAYSRKS